MQVCLYHLAAFDKTIMPWTGEAENSANDQKYSLKMGT